MADLPADCRILYGSLRVAPVLTEWWGAVLARLDGDRLTACCDTLLACGGRKTVRNELERRLRGGRATDHDPLLPFYLAVIRYEEREDYDAARFLDIMERADAAGRRRLREAATRLAPLVDPPLRQALQQFDFALLERMVPSFEDVLEIIEGLRGDIEDLQSDDDDDADPTAPVATADARASAREFQAALRKAARAGRLVPSEQGLLFEEQRLLFEDEANLVILDRLEAMIDARRPARSAAGNHERERRRRACRWGDSADTR